MSTEQFSRAIVGAGGQMDVPQIRAYIIGLKKYLTDYPQSEDTKQAFMDEIKAWENVLNNYKLVKPYAINHRERQQVKSKK